MKKFLLNILAALPYLVIIPVIIIGYLALIIYELFSYVAGPPWRWLCRKLKKKKEPKDIGLWLD